MKLSPEDPDYDSALTYARNAVNGAVHELRLLPGEALTPLLARLVVRLREAHLADGDAEEAALLEGVYTGLATEASQAGWPLVEP